MEKQEDRRETTQRGKGRKETQCGVGFGGGVKSKQNLKTAQMTWGKAKENHQEAGMVLKLSRRRTFNEKTCGNLSKEEEGQVRR